MVDTLIEPPVRLVPRSAVLLVVAYVVIALATLPLLAVLAAVAPDRATPEAWVHATVVAVLAAVLPVRLRSARRGDRGGWVAVVVISGALTVANFVEASIPGLFPGWMRIEMLVIAAVLVALLVTLARSQWRSPHPR